MTTTKQKKVRMLFPLAAGTYYEPVTRQSLAVSVSIEGQDFVLYRWNNRLLFRPAGWASKSSALFITRPLLAPSTGIDGMEQAFRTHYEDGHVGWFSLYTPQWAQGMDAAHLFFEKDGTGFCVDGEDQVAFEWEIDSLSQYMEAPDADDTKRKALCASVFEMQVNPRLSNPFVRPEDRQHIPLHWICGSEAELRRLTVLACHSEPELFAAHETFQETLKVMYRADAKGKLHSCRPNVSGSVRRNTTELCRKIFACNRFAGEIRGMAVKWPCRAQHYFCNSISVAVTVPPPSAHEQAEAFASIAEWLKDKVSDEERCALLGLL